MHDIPLYFQDEEAVSALFFYRQWKMMGFPYGSWGHNPNPLVEIVELLKPLDDLYHPSVI